MILARVPSDEEVFVAWLTWEGTAPLEEFKPMYAAHLEEMRGAPAV